MSSFSGITTALSGIQAQQAALNAITNNIANANDTNYHRQSAVTEEAPSTLDGSLWVGSGVNATSIHRSADSLLENQIFKSNQKVGESSVQNDALSQTVSVFNESSDSGLSNDLDQFWNAWQQLSVNPETTSLKETVVQDGAQVAGTLNQRSQDLQDILTDQTKQIKSDVDQVNSIATQLADLNDQIDAAKSAGAAPNNLLDKRYELLNSLSQLTDIQVSGDGGSGDIISVGGHTLVEGGISKKLQVGESATGQTEVEWSSDSSAATIGGGQLKGRMTLINDTLPGYQKTLDNVANLLITNVNDLHKQGTATDGTTGLDFFSGTGAGDIAVNSTLQSDSSKVAAGKTSAVGDGDTASAIADLQNAALSGKSTLGDAYQALITQIGGDSSLTTQRNDSLTSYQTQLTTQQQSVSGVSLNDELADMIRFQQGYNACSKLMSTMSDILGNLISQLGGS